MKRSNSDKAADEMSVLIADMNDQKIYGEEFYLNSRFRMLLTKLLTDYKVMVLAVDESMIAKDFKQMFSDENGGYVLMILTKIIESLE